MRRTPLKKRNPRRLARRRAEDFGPDARCEFLKTFFCVTCLSTKNLCPSHVVSRGSRRGKAHSTVPQCWRCHELVHHGGWSSVTDLSRAELEFLALIFEKLWIIHQLENGVDYSLLEDAVRNVEEVARRLAPELEYAHA